MSAGSAVAADASVPGPRDQLTVILTLKDRATFTPRWIDYHSRVGLPWPIIVGDGAPSEQTEAQFASASGLRTNYRRYADTDLLAFYRKLRDLVAAASTPYILLSDNDDFILPQGILRCIRFLDQNPDYVSCSGIIAGMYVTDRSFSDKDRVFGGSVYGLRSIYRPIDRTEPDAEQRATALLLDYVATWYAVHRRDALLKAFTDLVERKISDIGLMELLVAAELAMQGKQKIDASYVSYLRQLNSSQGASSSGGLGEAALSPSVRCDIDAVARSIASLAPGDEQGRATRIHEAIMQYRNTLTLRKVSLSGRAGRFAARYFHILRAKVPASRSIFSWIEMNGFLAALRSNGAGNSDLASVRKELGTVWLAAGADS
jgi:glycosyltransferase domain-containing protein